MITLFSVPHTGTHFLKKVLEDAGLTVKAKHWTGWLPVDGLIIAPIRDPKRTLQSWKARKRVQDFTGLWELFDKAYNSQNVFVLPIDTDNKDERLKELSKLLNVTLETDWAPLNVGPSSEHEEIKEDLTDIYKLKVVNDFYGKKEVKAEIKQKRTRRTRKQIEADQKVTNYPIEDRRIEKDL